MSGSNSSKIANLADGLWSLSVEELQEFGGVIEKILEAKKAVLLAEERSTEAGDKAVAQSFREIRDYLQDPRMEMSGPEAVILGSFYMHEDGHDSLDSKRLNIFLDSYDRKPANSTSIVDKLNSRGILRVDDDGLHSHKKFRLTSKGREESIELLSRLRRRGRDGGLAVVNR